MASTSGSIALQRRRCALAAVLIVTFGAAAQAPPPAPCSAAEHRQFDFWAGHWAVFTADGKRAGENRIEPIEGGCALQERWQGAGGLSGTSLNHWDAAARVWRQHWVDNRGGSLQLTGSFADGRMVLAGSAPRAAPAGATLQHRITWTPQPDGSVRQWWEVSSDGGKTWSTAFDGRYVRQP